VTVQTVQAVLTSLPLITGTGKYKIKANDAQRLQSRAAQSASSAIKDVKRNAKEYYEAIRFYLKSRWPKDFALQATPAAPSGGFFPGFFPGSNRQGGGGGAGSEGGTDQGTTQQDQGTTQQDQGTTQQDQGTTQQDQGALPGTQQDSMQPQPQPEATMPVEPMPPIEIPTTMTRAGDFLRQNKREITYGLAAVGIAAIAMRLFR
jgi:hypothetical protein